MEYYSKKEDSYFRHSRMDIISHIPDKKYHDVLEVGASGGHTLTAIKKLGIAENVTGLELFKLENTLQDSPEIKDFIIGDIESYENDMFNKKFDLIICGDVLEHLYDPWAVAKKLNSWLTDNGILILSIPNIREIKTLSKIFFKGTFEYEESGIMDKTHIRFFCKRNVMDMLQNAGFEIIHISSTNFYKQAPSSIKKLINKISFKLFQDILITQYIFTAKKH